MANNPEGLKGVTEKRVQIGSVQTTTALAGPVQTTTAQTGLVQTTTAQTGGTVNAPILHGNEFHGPVNIIYTGADLKHDDRSEMLTGKIASVSTTAQTGVSVTAPTEAAEECRDLKDIVKRTFRASFADLYEGTSLEGNHVRLEDTYTELSVIEGCTGGVNTEHEVRQIEAFYPKSEEQTVKFRDIFKVQSGLNVLGIKVLTLGIAGVGKTASIHKFILDWAEDKCNQDLDLILFLPFRELNLIKDEQYNFSELVQYFHNELRVEDVLKILNSSCLVAFILDGLDESKFPLNIDQKKVTNVTEKTTPDKLITSLIKGKLLPSALVWITSRPAAAIQIPRKYFKRVTEIHGFSDPQKEEYFRRRITDQDQAGRIISHIKTARSLHILCHIPVFCSISASVLQDMMKTNKDMTEAPTTLTEMYTRFLLFHTRMKSEKYSTTHYKERNRLDVESVLKLGKLAFLQLQKGQIIFYEKDLEECGIDFVEAVVYSGLCTQISKKDEKIFSFVHLSFQEFLAAVFVFLTFSPGYNPLLQTLMEKIRWLFKHTLDDLLKTAVKKAMKSENGQLELFLRFLFGLSLESNQRLLKSLQPEMEIKEESLKVTVDYIKRQIKKKKSTEETINLFHCLSEIKDNSLTGNIQKYLNSGDLSTQELSSTQWSALVFVLMMSEEIQEKFELKRYRLSEEGLRRLLPVVKNTRRALLDHCNLSGNICEALSSVLSSDSLLKELDLSNNDLQDSGVELLSAGLKSSHCKLEILRLSGCMITVKGCSSLDSALSSNPSHLKELDLTYNHPGESGEKLLSARLQDPHCSLSTLRIEHGGKIRIKQGLKKYGCEFTLDPITAHTRLSLCEKNRKVVGVREKQSYPDHPERFEEYWQVLCKESVSGRCYWEAEWGGKMVSVALTYKSIRRKGKSDDCRFGRNEKSWRLFCSNKRYSVLHNNNRTDLPPPPSNRVGVYVDCPAGTLSFYSVSSDTHTLTHLHTLSTTFTEPLYVGFGAYRTDSSVCVCELD